MMRVMQTDEALRMYSIGDFSMHLFSRTFEVIPLSGSHPPTATAPHALVWPTTDALPGPDPRTPD
jgi:hypothetical protein